MTLSRTPFFFVALTLTLSCDPTPPCDPPPQPTSVSASISAVTLASDCPASLAIVEREAGACQADANCPSLCRQSSVQLALSSVSIAPSQISLVAVRLIEAKTGNWAGTMTHREPTQWSNNAYVVWNETLPAGASLQVRYKLSAPSWNMTTLRATDSSFRLEIDLAVDGVIRTLTSAEVHQEPEVTT